MPQGADVLAARAKEQRTLQRRYDSSKQQAEHSKEAAVATKRQLDEVGAAHGLVCASVLQSVCG